MKPAIFFGLTALLCLFAGPGHAQTTWIVDHAGGGDFPTIQEGIDAAADGDTVLVREGTYAGTDNVNLSFDGKAITVRSEKGEGSTIIDGEFQHRGVVFNNGEGSDSVLEGFTIRKGFTIYDAALLITSASPTIRYCRIESTACYKRGAGIKIHEFSSPTLDHCTVTGTRSMTMDAVGVYITGYSSPTLTNCTITNNLDGTEGGGIHVGASPLTTMENCTISGNASVEGGGLFCKTNSYLTITNCLISGNTADFGGGGVQSYYNSSLTFTNTTISGNSAGYLGGGISLFYYSSATVTNGILWENSAPDGAQAHVYGGTVPSTLTIGHSDIQGGEAGVYAASGSTLIWGEGNIDSDPLFVSGPDGDHYLSQTASGQAEDSPCLDAGDPATEPWGWDLSTTRTDHAFDTDPPDMGAHYRVCSDADGDGYSPEGGNCGEPDCDDWAPEVNPGMVEIPGNGIDDDCDPSTPDTPAWGPAATAEASGHGPGLPCVTGMLNPLGMLLLPMFVAVCLKAVRKKR